MRDKDIMKDKLVIRDENPADYAAVHDIVQAAFSGHPYSSGTEHLIVCALRERKAAILALVAIEGKSVIGQIMFSPMTINGQDSNWHALGPVAVHPDHQRQGVGSQMIMKGLAQLRVMNSEGCILLGSLDYYGRFGFLPSVELRVPGLPQEHLLILPFSDAVPTGIAAFDEAFEVESASE